MPNDQTSTTDGAAAAGDWISLKQMRLTGDQHGDRPIGATGDDGSCATRNAHAAAADVPGAAATYTTAQRRGGRPRRSSYGMGERVSLSLRVTPECKVLMDQAAERSGRSQSQEVEHLIVLGLIFETLIAMGQAKLWGDTNV